jgi:Brp/Blh family beta-carotene 15,15'-monooxygenase
MNVTIETRWFAGISVIMLVSLGLFPDWLPDTFQVAFLAISVIFFGLPHGALDPSIARDCGLIHNRRTLVLFNSVYVGIVLMVLLVWQQAPVLSLAIFLAISAYHFSGDWRDSLPLWAQWISGAGLLLMPITFHTESVAAIFQALSGEEAVLLATTLAKLNLTVPMALAGMSVYAMWRKQWATALELISILSLAWVAPPLVFFIVYFCFLHSPRHLRGHFAQKPAIDHGKLWRMLVTYTLATLLLIAPLAFIWSELQMSDLVLRLVFVGLAGVTVPHMILMVYSERSDPTTQC